MRAGLCDPECIAYCHCADILDMMMAFHLGGVRERVLAGKVDQFLAACIGASWHDYMSPKFHWLIHLPHEFPLYSCFVHERKHRMVKRFTTEQRNTQSYERSILSEITCQHMADLMPITKFDLRVHLMPPTSIVKDAAACRLRTVTGLGDDVELRTARRARCSEHEVCTAKDVVLYEDGGRLTVAEVWLFFGARAHYTSAVLSVWTFHNNNVGQGTVDVKRTHDNVLIRPVADIRAACAYRVKANDMVQVLVPAHYRSWFF